MDSGAHFKDDVHLEMLAYRDRIRVALSGYVKK
jgi:hypothetical protein